MNLKPIINNSNDNIANSKFNQAFRPFPAVKALLIDVDNKRISQVIIDKENAYQEMCEQLGCEVLDAISIYEHRDYMYYDADGKYNHHNRYFNFFGRKFYGNAIIMGINHWGDCLSHKVEYRDVREELKF